MPHQVFMFFSGFAVSVGGRLLFGKSACLRIMFNRASACGQMEGSRSACAILEPIPVLNTVTVQV